MFFALKPLTESSKVGPPIQHVPGDALERWADWPYRVRMALLHAEMVEERADVVPVAPPEPNAAFAPMDEELTQIAESPVLADKVTQQGFACALCERDNFVSASALKRHVTRKHS